MINDLPPNSIGVLKNTSDLIPVDINSYKAKLGNQLIARKPLHAPKAKSPEGRLSNSQSDSVLATFKKRHHTLNESAVIVKQNSSTLRDDATRSRSSVQGSVEMSGSPPRGSGDSLGPSRRHNAISKLAPGEISRASEIILDALAASLKGSVTGAAPPNQSGN